MKANRNILILALFLPLLLILNCSKDKAKYGDIEGIVYDAITNEPLNGVLVSINNLNSLITIQIGILKCMLALD